MSRKTVSIIAFVIIPCLAEFTLPASKEVDSITDEQTATLFAFQFNTDPALERITEKHSAR